MAIADRETYERATALIAEHGSAALAHAALRAEAGRANGNPFTYSRWACAGHAILMIQDAERRGALH